MSHWWDKLVSGPDLDKAKRERRRDYVERRERRDAMSSLENEGWTYYSSYKDERFIKVRKDKRFDERFENRVWMLFYSMGYTTMNADNTFDIPYDTHNDGLTKQIDVFAYDGETVLMIECKSAERPRTKKDFKTEIESIGYYSKHIAGVVRSHFGRGIKIKTIFATSNCIVGETDKARLKALGIEYFDEEAIDYYMELAQHLGPTSKYQLLGKLFANTKIDNMKETVPAIKGTMGRHTYYSFSIEPERLLKIGYVLHRSDANRAMMPTYQRIIKKNRLRQVREFVEDGGYFPNSIIISIEAPKKGLKFDIKPGSEDSIAQLGILHLPKKYCSAYIIDGQHRLYGYSGTDYARTNTIPVVAFENLDKEEQIRLFMDINENQKAVPKNLRNTLSADLLWSSDNYSDRRKALRLRIAELLGEDQASPLYGHVLVGENKKSAYRCVTMDSIERGLKAGKLLSVFDRDNHLQSMGLLDSEQPDNDYAFSKVSSYIYASFNYIKERLTAEWEQGESSSGILTNNSGVSALLRVFSDILEFLIDQNVITSGRAENAESIIQKAEPMLDALVEFYDTIDPQLRMEIKTQYGGSGPVHHWRYLQKAIHEKIAEFTPAGFTSWWADNSKQHNDEAEVKLRYIKATIVNKVHMFMDRTDSELPYSMRLSFNDRLFKENEARKDRGESAADMWELFSLRDCRTLALAQGSLWTDGLNALFTRPGQEGRKGGTKNEKTKWLEDMHSIEQGLMKPGYSVKQAEYEYICSIESWLKGENSQNQSAIDNVGNSGS